MTIISKNQNGFTLIELLIALVIFAVGILGVGTMQLSSIQGNNKGRQISDAATGAADQMENFLSFAYDDFLDVDGDGTGQDADFDGNDDDGGNFGLDDLVNPDGVGDRDGDGVNDIFWNVAFDYPLRATKTIKVFTTTPGNSNPVSLEMIVSLYGQDRGAI